MLRVIYDSIDSRNEALATFNHPQLRDTPFTVCPIFQNRLILM